MIHSMTGYAAAQQVDNDLCYSLEIRSLNNRYLKLSVKLPAYLQFLESDVEKLVRSRLARGSITCVLRVRSDGVAGLLPINLSTLQQYVDQISRVRLPDSVTATIDLGTIAMLPGVCETPQIDEDARQHQQGVAANLTNRAIDALIEMRRQEGEALCSELNRCCDAIRSLLAEVAERAPTVVEEYHQRLKSRVEMLMQAGKLELEAEGLMREVAIYAERCDITEEVSRLGSHLDQFTQLCDRGNQVGRTLDFLTQELLREANTIASKSNDTAIAQRVVEIKGLIDRLREQVQNVE